MTEDEIHKIAVNRLESRRLIEPNPDDFEFWHVPNGAYYGGSAIRGAQFKRRGVRPGVPDLQIAYKGKMYFLELKREDGKLSTSQARFLKKMAAQGHETGVAYGLDDAINLLDGWGF